MVQNDENRSFFILLVVMASSFLVPFTSSALTLSLPDMGREFQVHSNELSWVLEIFLLSSIVCLLPAGSAADVFGKRRVFLLGTALFSLASLGCVVAPSFGLLLVARLCQGIGAAMIYATNMAILSLAFPPERRGWAMGWSLSMVYVGLSLGPVLGGFLNYYFRWHSILVFITVAGILTFLGILFGIRQEWKEQSAAIHDIRGTFLYAVAMVAFMDGISDFLLHWWAPYTLLIGIFLFFLFIWRQVRISQPLLPIHLFASNRLFALSNLAAMLNYSATFAIMFLLSLYLQVVLGFSSREAGLVLLIQPVVMAMLSPKMGALSDRYSPALLASSGMCLISLGIFGLAVTVYTHSFWPLMALLLLIGMGHSLFAAPNNNAIMGAVSKEYYSMASSMLGTVRLIGQVMSMALAAFLLSIEWQGLATQAVISRNIIIAFSLFIILCLGGAVASWKR